MNSFDIIVVGGGFAGVEAAHIASKLGAKTLLVTLNKKMISNMPCNPAIGGSAKGIVVREVDALGGIIGLLADQERLQIKMLNTGKGPGVQCLRAQEDKHGYPSAVQEYLSNMANLSIIEGMVVELLYDENKIKGVVLANGDKYYSRAIILANGTYLESEILRGKEKFSGGPDGEMPAHGLSSSLTKMGISLYRLKTGTPPRIDKNTIDFSKTTPQEGMAGYLNFSYRHENYVSLDNQMPCYLLYTNSKTHEIIRANLDNSAQFNGLVRGIGPRYCPSIEGKIVNFADKERHQLFLEPEFRHGDSYYLQGLATSMAKEVQEKIVHSLVGLENAKIIKYGYAIEYDAISAYEFDASLAIKKYHGLYGAGQIMGTSGYEEAAGLGIVAGINAFRYINELPPLILKRNEAYIGVMIDDIVTKGVDEPYRLLSSRAEYRLLLRHDNADVRLMPIAHEINTISKSEYESFSHRQEQKLVAIKLLKNTFIGASKDINTYLTSHNLPLINGSICAYDFLKRPEINFSTVEDLVKNLKELNLSPLVKRQLEIAIKYEGYIKKQEETAASYAKYDNYLLPSNLNYLSMNGLALEARQKLERIRPLTIGQASRISGVNPSDISILILELKRRQ